METSSSFRRSWTRAIRSRWRTFFRTLENRHAKRACVGVGVHSSVQWGAKRRLAQTPARTSEPGSEPASTTAHEGAPHALRIKGIDRKGTAMKIGWVGIGRMGLPMVNRLLDAKYQLTV